MDRMEVGMRADYPDLSPRDADAVEWWDAARAGQP